MEEKSICVLDDYKCELQPQEASSTQQTAEKYRRVQALLFTGKAFACSSGDTEHQLARRQAFHACASDFILKLTAFITIGFLLSIIIYNNSGLFHNLSKTAKDNRIKATVKVDRHTKFIRIIFLTNNNIVQNSSVVLKSDNRVEVYFPSPVGLSTARGENIISNGSTSELSRGVKITSKGNNCSLTIDNLDDIKVLKDSSQSRLVIDAYTG